MKRVLLFLALCAFVVLSAAAATAAGPRGEVSGGEPSLPPAEGCCDGTTVRFTKDGTAQSLDCAVNPSPYDICGWSEVLGRFDCGGPDPVPEGISPTCP